MKQYFIYTILFYVTFNNIYIQSFELSSSSFTLSKPFAIYQSHKSKRVAPPHRTTLVCCSSTTEEDTIEPKEVVKVFGRLAEKYIMLDSSGGMCCYSGCAGCEYRLPDGGYLVAEQSASRPKWIPSYIERSFESSGKEHVSKWSLDIFPDTATKITKDEFVDRVVQAKFTPPLGGPYVSASAAKIENIAVVEKFYNILSGDKDNLTKSRMGKQIKELSGGEEGLVWSNFIAAF